MEGIFGKAQRSERSKELGARLRQRRLALGLDQVQVMGRVAANASRKGVLLKGSVTTGNLDSRAYYDWVLTVVGQSAYPDLIA